MVGVGVSTPLQSRWDGNGKGVHVHVRVHVQLGREAVIRARLVRLINIHPQGNRRCFRVMLVVMLVVMLLWLRLYPGVKLRRCD